MVTPQEREEARVYAEAELAVAEAIDPDEAHGLEELAEITDGWHFRVALAYRRIANADVILSLLENQ